MAEHTLRDAKESQLALNKLIATSAGIDALSDHRGLPVTMPRKLSFLP
jgi:hypothetical protein